MTVKGSAAKTEAIKTTIEVAERDIAQIGARLVENEEIFTDL